MVSQNKSLPVIIKIKKKMEIELVPGKNNEVYHEICLDNSDFWWPLEVEGSRNEMFSKFGIPTLADCWSYFWAENGFNNFIA